ncbi:MAG: ACT domain-containing protein [Verrucomicrobiota bacterium]
MKQITVIAKESEDITTLITEALGASDINIESITLETIDESSVVSLLVDQYDEALLVLRDSGFDAVTEDALLIRVPDEPGSLAKIARRFHDADIQVRSLRIIRRRQGRAIVAVSVDRTNKAFELVKDSIISEDRLRQ